MGLDANGTRLLLYAKRQGVDFTRSAMIGRQFLSRVTPSDLKRNLREFGFTFDDPKIKFIFEGANGFAEPLLRFLGAKEVHSFDISDYEGATHVHDMNQEIPTSIKGQYSMVLDGGALEHIFNFPVAIRNCMEMLCNGGFYLGISPANNFMGHGFYQFSPEMYFNVFSEQNGYRLMRMVAWEDKPRAKWFAVRSPISVGGRVTLTNKAPTLLFVLAEKLKEVELFRKMPQQSDYVQVWEQAKDGSNGHGFAKQRSFFRSVFRKFVPNPVRERLRREWKYQSGFNPRFFEMMDRVQHSRDLFL